MANPLGKEILGIAGGGADYVIEAKVEAVLRTPNYDLYPIKTVTLDVHRNYITNLADITQVQMIFPTEDFINEIKPNSDDLEITIVTYNVGSKTKEEYDFVLTETNRNLESGKVPKEGTMMVKGQCINKLAYKKRLEHAETVYKKSTVGSVITSTLNGTLGKLGALGGFLTRNVKMALPNNNRVYDQIILPEGLNVLEVPNFLQNGKYGVYNGNIGTYIQRVNKVESIYVYPLYNLGKYDGSLELVIIDSGGDMSDNYECTYGKVDNKLKIIASTMNEDTPRNETNIKNSGTAIVGIEADAVMKRSAEVDKDKVTIKKDNYSRTMKHKVLKDGTAGVNAVGVTSNFYKHRSDILKNDGVMLTFKWEHSNADLLIPGMKVTHVLVKNDEIIKKPGILHGVTKLIKNENKTETSVLLVFVGV